MKATDNSEYTGSLIASSEPVLDASRPLRI